MYVEVPSPISNSVFEEIPPNESILTFESPRLIPVFGLWPWDLILGLQVTLYVEPSLDVFSGGRKNIKNLANEIVREGGDVRVEMETNKLERI